MWDLPTPTNLGKGCGGGEARGLFIYRLPSLHTCDTPHEKTLTPYSLVSTDHHHYITITMSQQFSTADVAQYNGAKGLYIIIDANVYNVTGTSPCPFPSCHPLALVHHGEPRLIPILEFADDHPGGAKILKRVAGKDASKQFWKYHNEGVLKKYGAKLQVGSVKEEPKL